MISTARRLGSVSAHLSQPLQSSGTGWRGLGGGAAGPSVYGVRREAPGADGAVSVQAQTVGRRRRRRAKGAATSESTPPLPYLPLHTRAYLHFTAPTVGALILLRRDTQTGELTQIESHTGAEEERASCHVGELTRLGPRDDWLMCRAGVRGKRVGARADRERGTLAAAAAAALRHRSRSHKLAMVVESPCGSRMHAHTHAHN